jgi:hypothetical protein
VLLADDDAAADASALSAAEPVVTETMAELYLRQGHREDALRVYRALLADRPDDARLAAKVDELSGVARPTPAKQPVGQSAAGFLRRVLRGEPGVPAPDVAPPPPATTLDAVFAGAPRDTAASPQDLMAEPPGAPTAPADDVISLDAVFGDQVGRVAGAELPLPAPAGGQGEGGDERAASGGFSFDDFFSPGAGDAGRGAGRGGGGTGAGGAGGGGGRGSRPQVDEEDLDQFQTWLKGLKA